MSKFTIHSLGEKFGQKLSDFKFVLLTLVTYSTLCFLTLVWMFISYSPDYNQAQLITYAIATGGDPYNFRSEMGDDRFLLWNWLLILHVFAWLIVPVLAGTVVSAAFISWERKKSRLEEQLLNIMKIEIKKDSEHLTDEELEKESQKQLKNLIA